MNNEIIFVESPEEGAKSTPIWVSMINCLNLLVRETRSPLSFEIEKEIDKEFEYDDDGELHGDLLEMMNTLVSDEQTFGLKLSNVPGTRLLQFQFNNEADMTAFILRWHP